MNQPIVTPQTTVVIAVFVVVYVGFLLRKTIRNELDLFDFLSLSALAFIPGILVFIPSLAWFLTELAGVTFPFLVMFGALFLVAFIVLHRLIVQNHQLQRRTTLLVQELGLLRLRLEQSSGESKGNANRPPDGQAMRRQD